MCGAVQWGDVPTWGLFIGAVFTAVLAGLAFRKQSQELTTLQQQVKDGETLIEQQTELITIQSGQLEEQRKFTEAQIGVIKLQTQELEASVKDRQMQRKAQASQVLVLLERTLDPRVDQAQAASGTPRQVVLSLDVKNDSDRPIRDVQYAWFDGEPKDLAETLWPGSRVNDQLTIPDLGQVDLIKPVVFFRDAFGFKWRATHDGQLDQVTD